MMISAAVCRAQEAAQLDISINDPLENRRKIAATAAKAWAREAELAEWQEAGGKSGLSKLDADISAEFASETEAEMEAAREPSHKSPGAFC